jgi:hypothetical protein
MASPTITVRDPSWADLIPPIAIVTVIAGAFVGLVAGWLWGAAAALVVAIISVSIAYRFFDRRTLQITGSRIVMTDRSGTQEVDVAELTSIRADHVFHVGRRVDLASPRTTIGDIDPGSASGFLRAVGQVLSEQGRDTICSPEARPFLGL